MSAYNTAPEFITAMRHCFRRLSGYTTRAVSKYRPKAAIVAYATNKMVARHLNLRWGVYTVPGIMWNDAAEMERGAAKAARDYGFVKDGDLTIMTSGMKLGEGHTSAIRVHSI